MVARELPPNVVLVGQVSGIKDPWNVWFDSRTPAEFYMRNSAVSESANYHRFKLAPYENMAAPKNDMVGRAAALTLAFIDDRTHSTPINEVF